MTFISAVRADLKASLIRPYSSLRLRLLDPTRALPKLVFIVESLTHLILH